MCRPAPPAEGIIPRLRGSAREKYNPWGAAHDGRLRGGGILAGAVARARGVGYPPLVNVGKAPRCGLPTDGVSRTAEVGWWPTVDQRVSVVGWLTFPRIRPTIPACGRAACRQGAAGREGAEDWGHSLSGTGVTE